MLARVKRRAMRRASLPAGRLATTALIAPVTPAAADPSATWAPVGSSTDYNAAGNWNPAGVPTDQAIFEDERANKVTFSADVSIRRWSVEAGNPFSSAITFTNQSNVITFQGGGISGRADVINGAGGTINFTGSSVAGLFLR